MSTGSGNGGFFGGIVIPGDSAARDAFSRDRVSNPIGLLDAQFTYDLQPLIFEQITNGTGATISHDATNRMALMAFSSTPTGGKAYMQSYEYFRYQAGCGQLPIVTFNFNEGVADCVKFAQYGDDTNAYGFRMNGTTPEFYILSGTDNGNQVKAQGTWSIDNLDGSGASGITFDASKEQILIVDFQALYVGRVRVGLDIGGQIVYCHEFLHANATTKPYIQNASLPVRVGMTCTGTVTTSMWWNCATVISEGGADEVAGYSFRQPVLVTIANGTPTHVMSLRPKTTFNSIANRSKFVLESVSILAGLFPVEWHFAIGQAISGATTFNAVNSNYSAMEYNLLGTLSGSPAITFGGDYLGTSEANRGSVQSRISNKYPITLDAAGAVRSLGTLTLIGEAYGGASACRLTLNWREIR